MKLELGNWKTQIRKGYLEICLLTLVGQNKQMYGSEILKSLATYSLVVKEGTLYPMLSRMTDDGILSAAWDITNVKGHPRKFYTLTAQGKKTLAGMHDEFDKVVEIFHILKRGEKPTPDLLK